jgi:hypothetical protein
MKKKLFSIFLLGTLLICFNATAQSEIKRNPNHTKEGANLFYDPAYTLFDFWSDEPIFPDADGYYQLYYATDKDKIPRMLKADSEALLIHDLKTRAYKFKKYSNCKNWCEGKIFVPKKIKSYEDTKNSTDVYDFGISKINFSEIGDIKSKRYSDAIILEGMFRESLCYSVSNYLDNSVFYDSLFRKANVMNKLAELLADKLKIDGNKDVSPVFFMAIKGIQPGLTSNDLKGKKALDMIIYFADFIRNNYETFERAGCGRTPNITVQAYPFDFQEEEELAEIKRKAELNNGSYENSARNYCISTTYNKYILSLFDDGSKKVIYKLYDKNGNLTKTMQGVWEIKDGGVYGAAYFIYISWTGVNSNMVNLKFTCQYNANRVLQSIIDSQGRTWFECQ